MISDFVYFSSFIMVATVFFMPFLGVKRMFFLQITLMSVSHVYATGIALFGTMAFYYITVFIQRESVIYLPKAIVFVWCVWLVLALFSWFFNGVSVRGVLQGVEFVFYGVLICFIYDIGRRKFVTLDEITIMLVISSFLLALLFIVAGYGLHEWPAHLIGRNEGAFFLVLSGLGPALFLFTKYTGKKKYLLVFVVFIICIGISGSDSRSGIAMSFTVISLYILFVLFGFSLIKVSLSLILLCLIAISILPVDDFLKHSFDVSHNHYNMERLVLLMTSYDLFLQKPFFGWGWGKIEFLMPTYAATVGSYPHPHNTYARFLVELGFIGLFVFVAPLIIIFFQFIQSLKLGFYHFAVFQGVTSLVVILFAFVDALFYGANRGLSLSIMIGVCFSMAAFLKSHNYSELNCEQKRRYFLTCNRNASFKHIDVS